MRHGNTTWDTRVDALLNPPLDEEGIERIKRTVEFIDSLPYKPIRIISSPLQRTLLTAEMISRGDYKVTTHNGALPWNLGDLMGKQDKVVQDKIEYLESYPDIKAPHGESYRHFISRWSEFLHRVMAYAERQEEPVLVTTHSRNINSLGEVLGEEPLGAVSEKTKEGSVTLLAKNGVSDWTHTVIWDGK